MHNHCFTPHLWVAQHSHSEKRHQPHQIFLEYQYNLFYPFFLEYKNAEHSSCPMSQTAHLCPQLCKKTRSQTESPRAIAQDFHKQPQSNSAWGSPSPAPALLPSHWHRGYNSILFTNPAAAFGKEWAALTEHLREQKSKIPGMWQRAAQRGRCSDLITQAGLKAYAQEYVN